MAAMAAGEEGLHAARRCAAPGAALRCTFFRQNTGSATAIEAGIQASTVPLEATPLDDRFGVTGCGQRPFASSTGGSLRAQVARPQV